MLLHSSHFASCPYCLEQIEIIVDGSAGSQTYTEDCEVCCHPILVKFMVEDNKISNIELLKENE